MTKARCISPVSATLHGGGVPESVPKVLRMRAILPYRAQAATRPISILR
jgi:hypothetical protein